MAKTRPSKAAKITKTRRDDDDDHDDCRTLTTVNVLHLLNIVDARYTGPGEVAFNLAKHEGCQLDVSLWHVESNKNRPVEPADDCKDGAVVKIYSFAPWGGGTLFYPRGLIGELVSSGAGGKFHLLHLHGLWTSVSIAAQIWGTKWRRPIMISAHGSLTPWALAHRRWKKLLALKAYERRSLEHAACLHAVSSAEVYDYRACGLKNPVALVPNGIGQDWIDASPDPASFRAAFGIPREKRILLFLGRISDKKGLPLLLDALSTVRSLLKEWRVVIAGTDEFGHLAAIVAQCKRLCLDKVVTFVGPLYGQQKRDAFGSASLFVLPSLSEGAPVAVLEAIGAGIPTIVTKASPWRELEERGCGWWPDISSEAIAECLREALNMSERDLCCMGSIGKRLTAEKYTWQVHATSMARVHAWLTGTASKPSELIFD